MPHAPRQAFCECSISLPMLQCKSTCQCIAALLRFCLGPPHHLHSETGLCLPCAGSSFLLSSFSARVVGHSAASALHPPTLVTHLTRACCRATVIPMPSRTVSFKTLRSWPWSPTPASSSPPARCLLSRAMSGSRTWHSGSPHLRHWVTPWRPWWR